jgi:HSP20 family protein
MSIIKWDPYKTMKQVQESIDSMYETSVVKSKYSEEEISHCDWVPDVDIYEDDEMIVIKADLPSVDDKDVNIKYDNSMLILKGERKFNPETNLENYKRIERPYGTFIRKFGVPSDVDINTIRAKRAGGVLRIELPKVKAGVESISESATKSAEQNDPD